MLYQSILVERDAKVTPVPLPTLPTVEGQPFSEAKSESSKIVAVETGEQKKPVNLLSFEIFRENYSSQSMKWIGMRLVSFKLVN